MIILLVDIRVFFKKGIGFFLKENILKGNFREEEVLIERIGR